MKSITRAAKKAGVNTGPKAGNLVITQFDMDTFIPEPHQQYTLNKIRAAVEEGWATKVDNMNTDYGIRVGGNSSDCDDGILILCYPAWKHTNRFFRVIVETDVVDLGKLKSSVDRIFPLGYEGFMQYGILRSAEMTVDVENTIPKDIILFHPKNECKSWSSSNGLLEEIYLPLGDGQDLELTNIIHNTTIQHVEQQCEGNATLEKKSMRIKLRLDDLQCTLKKLRKIPNPFESLSMISCCDQYTKDIWTLLFTQFGEQEDVSEYLTPQGCASYKSYYDARFKTRCWWNPEKVWKGIFGATKAIITA
jgi:hypothetical protein